MLLALSVDARDGNVADDTVFAAIELLPPIRVAVVVTRIASPNFLSPGFFLRTALSVGSGFIVEEYPAEELLRAAARNDVLVFTDAAILPEDDNAGINAKGWFVFAHGQSDAFLARPFWEGLVAHNEDEKEKEEGVAIEGDFPPFAMLDTFAVADIRWGEGWKLSLIHI